MTTRLLTMVMVCAIASAGMFGCEKVQLGGGATDEEKTMTKTDSGMPEKSMSAATIVIGDKSWTVEVATTDEERIKGLSGREGLAVMNGMWFVFPTDVQDPFWMKDTHFDLDMVFVGPDMKIVDVKPGNVKLTETLVQPVGSYRYVLETNAGEAKDLKIGDVAEYRIGPK